MQTLIDVLEETVRTWGDRPAMKHKRDGAWHTTTWREYREQAYLAGRGFLRLGLGPRQGVAIMSYNRPEWFLADVGAVAAGGVPTGIYTTSSTEQCAYIARHCEATVVVVETREHLEKFLEIRDDLPDLEALILLEGETSEAEENERIFSWARLLELGHEVRSDELEKRARALQPGDTAALIYTSGTTGPPKAVVLTHHNITWTARQTADAYEVVCDESLISYLPLSHIAEQLLSLHITMTVGACAWFAENLDALRDNLREVRPQFFFGVPRVWEKIQAGIQQAGAENSWLKKRIAAWARGVGLRKVAAQQRGEDPPWEYELARKLVFSKVRDRLGLDRARVCATSTAPIARETLDFFASLDIPLLEVYGMSECTGPTTLSPADDFRLGTVGKPIEGTELKIAEDGEILMRGPHVFAGYAKNEEATRETLDEDGWLHSGDVGTIDEDGFLSVTDRKKDLLITSGGKNVAPQNLESRLKLLSVISQAVAVGDRRKFVAALVTLNPDKIEAEARAAGSPARTPEEAARCEIFQAHLMERVEEVVNPGLARFETIKKIAILPRELSLEEGELTPTLKIKRRVVTDRWAEEIDRLYA